MALSTRIVDRVTDWITGSEPVDRCALAQALGSAPDSIETRSYLDVISSLGLSNVSVRLRRRTSLWWDLSVVSAAGIPGHIYVAQKGDDGLTGVRASVDSFSLPRTPDDLLSSLETIGVAAAVHCQGADIGEPRPAVSSLAKVFVLLAVLELADKDDLDLDDSVSVRADDLSFLGSQIGPQHIGRKIALRRLCINIARQSCNTSTDILTRTVGPQRVFEVANECGAGITEPLPLTRDWIESAWGPLVEESASDYCAHDAALRSVCWSLPRHDDGLDYHLPLAAITSALARISRCSWNPWSGSLPPMGKQRIFKGGNAPGVMAGSWFGHPDAEFAFAVNSPKAIGLLEEIWIHDMSHGFYDRIVAH